MKKVIGVDIGGTNTSLALVNEKYELSRRMEFPTPGSPEETAGILRDKIQEIDPDKELPCGIAVCGLISPDGRRLCLAPNLGWKDIYFKEVFKNLKRSFAIVNDGNSAAWGCYVAGEGRNNSRLLSMTLGTGVGGGVVLDGNLLFGAGELGHIKLEADGPQCGCGKRGCLESYIGGRFIPSRAKEWAGLEVKTARELFELSEKGSKKAVECWKKVGYIAGYALSGVVNLNGIEKIVLGGAITSYEGKYFLSVLKNSFRENLMVEDCQSCEIVISKWKKDMSLVGAAAVLLSPPKNFCKERLISGR